MASVRRSGLKQGKSSSLSGSWHANDQLGFGDTGATAQYYETPPKNCTFPGLTPTPVNVPGAFPG